MRGSLKMSEKLLAVAGLLSVISVAANQLAAIIKLMEDDRLSDFRPTSHGPDISSIRRSETCKNYFEM